MKHYILVRQTVQDYNVWKKVFDGATSWREQQGERSFQVFRDDSDPNQVTILSEWQSIESAKNFIGNEELRKKLQEGGVIFQPTVFFLKRD